ncbi:hypothetical protein G7054_g7174 [Neopestalotiopsis clavispora]|nr:hypothetical protein G7054_g7174 [Neopestalotiopsis clavispora]
MQIGFFDPRYSNPAWSFNLRGLQPVIRVVNHGRFYLLKDEEDNFCRWDCEDWDLWLIVKATNLEEALDQIIYHPIMMETEVIGNNLYEAPSQ